ncbi:serine/arginine repetitive matrix protein 2-like [Leguminivora glycinivorella]|uniref:serine/arginine repetitive matrix protein 2-like n=1 Tax=Leguminivora glycinivorella TaxID=1035111 RepID=UPI00200EF664|nr:serine/arginine repetitive matrix protein 2-like [Leguminivora glycinivorella]
MHNNNKTNPSPKIKTSSSLGLLNQTLDGTPERERRGRHEGKNETMDRDLIYPADLGFAADEAPGQRTPTEKPQGEKRKRLSHSHTPPPSSTTPLPSPPLPDIIRNTSPNTENTGNPKQQQIQQKNDDNKPSSSSSSSSSTSSSSSSSASSASTASPPHSPRSLHSPTTPPPMSPTSTTPTKAPASQPRPSPLPSPTSSSSSSPSPTPSSPQRASQSTKTTTNTPVHPQTPQMLPLPNPTPNGNPNPKEVTTTPTKPHNQRNQHKIKQCTLCGYVSRNGHMLRHQSSVHKGLMVERGRKEFKKHGAFETDTPAKKYCPQKHLPPLWLVRAVTGVNKRWLEALYTGIIPEDEGEEEEEEN